MSRQDKKQANIITAVLAGIFLVAMSTTGIVYADDSSSSSGSGSGSSSSGSGSSDSGSSGSSSSSGSGSSSDSGSGSTNTPTGNTPPPTDNTPTPPPGNTPQDPPTNDHVCHEHMGCHDGHDNHIFVIRRTVVEHPDSGHSSSSNHGPTPEQQSCIASVIQLGFTSHSSEAPQSTYQSVMGCLS